MAVKGTKMSSSLLKKKHGAKKQGCQWVMGKYPDLLSVSQKLESTTSIFLINFIAEHPSLNKFLFLDQGSAGLLI